MHELGIVFHIIKSVEEVGEANALSAVSSVTLEVGEVSTVIDTFLLDCWKWAANKSDLLRNSNLLIEKIEAVTICEECNQLYGTVEHGRTCPYCASEYTHLVTGNEVNIKEIEAS